MIYVLLGVGGVLRSRGSWPNNVRWIFRVRRKVAEGLAIVEPPLSSLGGGVGVVDGGDIICFSEEGIPLGAEFLEGLGVDEFLELSFELLLWGFSVTFGETDRFPCYPPGTSIRNTINIQDFKK